MYIFSIKWRFVGILHGAQDGKVVLTRYNLYKGTIVNSVFDHAPEETTSVFDLFPIFPMSGYTFTVAALPYDANVISDVDPDGDDTHKYTNHWGLEPYMVETIGQALASPSCSNI